MIENEEYLGLDRRNSEKILINIYRTFLFLHFNDSKWLIDNGNDYSTAS